MPELVVTETSLDFGLKVRACLQVRVTKRLRSASLMRVVALVMPGVSIKSSLTNSVLEAVTLLKLRVRRLRIATELYLSSVRTF